MKIIQENILLIEKIEELETKLNNSKRDYAQEQAEIREKMGMLEKQIENLDKTSKGNNVFIIIKLSLNQKFFN